MVTDNQLSFSCRKDLTLAFGQHKLIPCRWTVNQPNIAITLFCMDLTQASRFRAPCKWAVCKWQVLKAADRSTTGILILEPADALTAQLNLPTWRLFVSLLEQQRHKPGKTPCLKHWNGPCRGMHAERCILSGTRCPTNSRRNNPGRCLAKSCKIAGTKG